MNFKNLSSRELITIIIGAIIVVGFLIWFFVILSGQEKLDIDRQYVAKYKKVLREAKIKLRRKKILEIEYNSLIENFSNQLGRIGDMRMPYDIDDQLRIEFNNVDRTYGSSIGRANFKKIETNEVYNLLKYGLSDVQCDWKSLNAALYLIENSGQLVGFGTLSINADAKDRRNVKTKVRMNIESFIFPNRGTRPWKMPDYTSVESDLGKNIFQIPESMIPQSPAKGKTGLKPGQPPPFMRSTTLTGIVKFGGKLFAIFKDKLKKKEYRIGINGMISNTTATVISIDRTNESVNIIFNGETFNLPLRKYREQMFTTKKPLTLLTGLRRSQPEDAKPSSEPEPYIDDNQETNVPAIVTEKTEVPDDYKKTVGSYTECISKIRAWTEKVNKYNKRRFRLNSDYGMIITRLNKVSPLLKAGLQRRDVIISIGGLKVDSNATFTYAMNKACEYGKTFPVTVMRGKNVKKVTINLE
ncbi:PDZ domain-containing protein [bacterium]|nr:PDZ domain-containing protein [bacterium]